MIKKKKGICVGKLVGLIENPIFKKMKDRIYYLARIKQRTVNKKEVLGSLLGAPDGHLAF